MSRKGERFERRLAERRALRPQEETAEASPLPVPPERRTKERRVRQMTPKEVEDWLRHNIKAKRRRR